jgi:hypothetical protein
MLKREPEKTGRYFKANPAGHHVSQRDLIGSKTADIYFEAFDNSKANFAAEITAISDMGVDKMNPYEKLSDILHRLVRKSGLRANSFNLRVGKHPGPTFKGGPSIIIVKD